MAQLGNLIVTGVAKLLSKLYVSDSVTAPTFIGKLQGNADTATKVNGHTVNSDVPSGAKFTDTNTWRGVQDNLTSTAADQSLSANQGKVLKGLVDGKAASNHTHNYVSNPGNHKETASGTTANAATTGMLYSSGLYMTQSYNDSATPATYGNIINIAGAGTGQLLCGWSGADNTTDHLYYRSHRDTNTGGWGAWNTILDSANWSNYAAAKSHTHNYAGSSSAGGDATNATKWGGYTNDIGTNNTSDTWLLVANNGKIQHRLATSFAAASHTHSYLPLSGGTLTGRSTRAGGGAWISDRNNVALFGTGTGSDSYNCIVGQKTPKGAWTIGNLGSNENLVFNYSTDTNFNAGTNNTNVVYLPPTGGTIALTNIIQYGTSAPSSLANGHLFCVIE